MASSSNYVPVAGVTVNIDPDGDAVLEIGSTDVKGHLRVSSKVLALASPVFAAMFGPRFLEGNILAQSKTPITVPLPEDNPDAVTLLANILHLRTNEVPTNPSLKTLEEFAVLCDKYDCSRAIRPWSMLWLQAYESHVGEKDYDVLLVIAYALDLPQSFLKISREIIIKRQGPLTNFPPAELLPEAVLEECKCQTTVFFFNFRNALDSLILPIIKAQSCCISFDPYGPSMTTSNYLQKLADVELWPLLDSFKNISISTVSERTSQMQELPSRGCGNYKCTNVCNRLFKPMVEQALKEQLNKVKGLCIDCVKSGGDLEFPNQTERKCRIEHDRIEVAWI